MRPERPARIGATAAKKVVVGGVAKVENKFRSRLVPTTAALPRKGCVMGCVGTRLCAMVVVGVNNVMIIFQ